ncbi:hypothetical protein RvY_04106 [Ramazzottius varieornatus]|uniref:Uncharacterized protein n=1 Tax=Ramazzottius varieornatus TaxID=947166 RepID=A0A1D1UTW1_RAMVA|nr:hypothetical protein RvY_04106 [Ramazzottius varieornatus]
MHSNSVEPIEGDHEYKSDLTNVQYEPAPGTVSNGSSSGRPSQSYIQSNLHGQRASQAMTSPPPRMYDTTNGLPPKSGGSGVAGMMAGAVTNFIAPTKDPLWYKGANAYSIRKTVVLGLLDIALLTSTAGQLKSLLRINPAYPFYNTLLGMLIVCILGEIAIGLLCFFVGRLNINQERDRPQANVLQNVVLGIAVVLLILHIMITSFGIEDLWYISPNYAYPVTSNSLPTALPQNQRQIYGFASTPLSTYPSTTLMTLFPNLSNFRWPENSTLNISRSSP